MSQPLTDPTLHQVSVPVVPRHRRAGMRAHAPAWLLAAALWLVLAAPAWGQVKPDEVSQEVAPVDPAVELAPLLSEDSAQWFAELRELREYPEHARELLLAAIEQDVQLPRRWRIYHHMVEFGRMEDIPILLERLATVEDPLERTALRGAAQALYEPAHVGAELARAVEELSFLQTRAPVTLNSDKAGRLAVSRETFRELHLDGLPITVIRKLQPMRGHSYETEEGLGKALERSLNKKEWEAHRQELLAAVQRVPERVAQEGTLRVKLRNSLERPLMVRLRFEAWFGTFDPPLEPVFVYIEPGNTAQHDLPVRIVKNRDRPEVRVDMRMREVHGGFVPTFQKLYIASQ